MTATQLEVERKSPLMRVPAFLWAIVRGVGRDFMWVAVRDGMIRLKGYSAAMKAVVIVASVLLVATIVDFASGDILRTGSHLIVTPDGVTGRGSLVPQLLVPATFVLVAFGAALALAGALHATWPVRIAVLLLYAGIGMSFQGLAQSEQGLVHSTLWPGWVFLAGVLAVFIVRWRSQPRPAAEFGVLLVLVSGAFAVSENALVRADQVSGHSYAIQGLALLLGLLTLLPTPLLFVAGLDVVAFGAQASSWVLTFVDRHVPMRWVYALLAALAAWRTRDLTLQTIHLVQDGGVSALEPALGALVMVGVLWAYWFALGRFSGSHPGTTNGEDKVKHESAAVRLPLGMAYAGLSLALVPELIALQCFSYFGIDQRPLVSRIQDLADFFGRTGVVTVYRSLLGVCLAVVGLVVARRGARAVGMFLGAVGLTDLLQQGLVHISALEKFFWSGPENLDLAWMALFVGVGVWWLARRQLTEIRAERLLFLILLAALLRQFDFISDPFAPLLGFAGIGFVVFGLIWGFLTAGGWANESSARFPRSSRTFLYLGYSLFSVALLNWFAVTHDVPELSRFQSFGSNGVALLGYPLIYALFTLVLAGAFVDRPIDRDEEEEEEVIEA